MRSALILAVLLSGCATWDSLRPGVERTCTNSRCYIIGTKEQIDRHCRKGGGKWDSGKLQADGDGLRARCCTKHFPDRKRKFEIWISREDFDCIIHEECHIEEFESGRNEHWRCDGFGLGKEKTRLVHSYP